MIAGYIMTGGKNSRMGGQKKLFLTLEGETFLERIVSVLDIFPQIYLSVDQTDPYKHLGIPMIIDKIQEIGPLGGIFSGFCECEEEALFVVACDMPFLSEDTISAIRTAYDREKKPCIAEVDGRLHPLLGIYPRTLLPVIMQQIESGNYSMKALLEKTEIVKVKLKDTDRSIVNINTKEEYALVSRGADMRESSVKKPFFFAISGYKNTGKTTMITRLLPVLTERGYKVAVIKHDGHDFEGDVPGTDSYRHYQAGAYGTAVFSENQILLHKKCREVDEVQIAKIFPEADIILIEGLKNSNYPKYLCNYPREPLMDSEELADLIEKEKYGEGTKDERHSVDR